MNPTRRKPSTPIVLVGALLVALAALSSVKHRARSDTAGRGGGVCCPLMPAWERMPLLPGTNGSLSNCNTSTPPATNRT